VDDDTKSLVRGDEAAVTLAPRVIKGRVQQAERKQSAQVKIVQKAVLTQIHSLGHDGVSKLLHPVKPRPGQVSHVEHSSKSAGQKEIKQVQQQALAELKSLVSPTSAHRPSIVKNKLGTKKAKKDVGAQVVKAAAVREIKAKSKN
jgi:hypothetical protein